VSDGEISAGSRVLGMEFVKEGMGERHETLGTATFYIDDQVVASGPLRTQPGHFALCGEGLSIGHDSGDPVSAEYAAGFPFAGGRIVEVEVSIGDDVYLDVERDFAAAMARD
jgi:arylsulfatase